MTACMSNQHAAACAVGDVKCAPGYSIVRWEPGCIRLVRALGENDAAPVPDVLPMFQRLLCAA